MGNYGRCDVVKDCWQAMSIGKKSRNQSRKARETVFRRDSGVCVSIGISGPCSDSVTLQHRVGRGMGGSAQFDTIPPYLLTMCSTHNWLETSDADYHKICKDLGWSVPRWVPDSWSITEVPVFYWDGWHYLVGNERILTTVKSALDRMETIYGD